YEDGVTEASAVILSVRTVRWRGGCEGSLRASSLRVGHLMLSDSLGKRSLNCGAGKRSSKLSPSVACALAASVCVGGALPHWTSREESGTSTARRAIARQRGDMPSGIARPARSCGVDFGSTPIIHPP